MMNSSTTTKTLAGRFRSTIALGVGSVLILGACGVGDSGSPAADKEWTFTLRKGVTFQDGTPFDAKAVAFAIDRAVNSDLGCDVEGQIFGDPDLTVDVVDDTTLVVTTEEPDPVLPLVVHRDRCPD